MKKPLTGLVVLLAGAFAAHAQGTVSFGNYLTSPSYIYVSLVNYRLSPPVLSNGYSGGLSTITTGNPREDVANGSDWTVELYGNAGANDAASTLTPATVQGSPGTLVTATLAGGGAGQYLGTWFSSTIADIPGTTLANQPATVQIYAWYNDGGRVTSYAAALADGYPVGFSTTANIITGGPQLSAPPTTPPNLPIFGPGIPGYGIEITSVPEPSMTALGLIGAAALLLRRHRAF